MKDKEHLKDQRISLRIKSDMATRVRGAASAKGVKLSEALRQCLEGGLAVMEKGKEGV